MGIVTSIVAATAAIGGTAYSVDRQRAAAKDQQRAARTERRKVAIQNARERRMAAAKAQVSRSQIEAGQASTGYSSTGQSHGISAINSQLAGSLGHSRDVEGMNDSIIRSQMASNQKMTQAGYGSAIAGLPGQLGFGLGDQIKSNLSQGKGFLGGQSSTGINLTGQPISPWMQGSSFGGGGIQA